MKLSLYEQETIILYNQVEATAEVYSHDPRLLEKLRRLAEKYPDQIVKKDRQTFTVPKRCVSVREPYSAERRKAASERAKAAGYKHIIGEYLPTSKNKMVEQHYPNLGFEKVDGSATLLYELDVYNYKVRECYIEIKK